MFYRRSHAISHTLRRCAGEVRGLLATGLFLAFAGGCVSTRLEPLSSQTPLSQLHEKERELWASADKIEGQIAACLTPAADYERAEKYLSEVVQKLTTEFNNPNVRVRIRVLPDPNPNAFVLPNGAMYVNSGLLALLENEAQIATALGHEFAHFRNRHSYRERIREHNELVKGVLIGGTLGVLAAAPDAAGSMAEVWQISSISGYSRNLESEADHASLLLVLQAGYQPEQALRVFEQLQALSPDDEEQDRRFATHPRLSERIDSYRRCLNEPEIRQRATGSLVADDVYDDALFGVVLENAGLNLAAGNYMLAEMNIRRCLRVHPESARAHYLAGELERNGPTGTACAAIECYARALRLDPNCIEAYREIGLLHRESGDRDKAAQSLRKYLERASSAPDAPLMRSFLQAVEDANTPSRPLYRPLPITAGTLRDRAKTVGVLPMFIPDDIIEPARRREEFEETLIADLKQAGFVVVPPSAYETIFESMQKAMGTLYDPNTGQPLQDRHDMLARHAFREYMVTHRIDALAHPCLVAFGAKWQVNRAEWHGIQESATGKEGFWADLAAPSAHGTIPALSFRVTILSAYGEFCYLGLGGIQLCSRVAGGGFVEVPAHELLVDSARNARSVHIACQNLLQETP